MPVVLPKHALQGHVGAIQNLGQFPYFRLTLKSHNKRPQRKPAPMNSPTIGGHVLSRPTTLPIIPRPAPFS